VSQQEWEHLDGRRAGGKPPPNSTVLSSNQEGLEQRSTLLFNVPSPLRKVGRIRMNYRF
jgi:hypothetical protein